MATTPTGVWLFLSRGEEPELHIRLIGSGAFTVFWKRYQSWQSGKLAREQIHDEDMREDWREEHRGAPCIPAPIAPMESTSRGSGNVASVQHWGVPSALVGGVHSGVYDDAHGPSGVALPPQRQGEVPQDMPGGRALAVCFECGWPRSGAHPTGGSKKHSGRPSICLVAQTHYNPDLGDICREKHKSYKAFCKSKGIEPVHLITASEGV